MRSLELRNPREFNALLGMWKEILVPQYFLAEEILWLMRAFLGGHAEVLLYLIHYLENIFFSDVAHNKFLNNRGAACKLESPLKC